MVAENIPVEAIARILEYMERDEARHFENCTKIERIGHIYHQVRALRAWFNSDAIPAEARSNRQHG